MDVQKIIGVIQTAQQIIEVAADAVATANGLVEAVRGTLSETDQARLDAEYEQLVEHRQELSARFDAVLEIAEKN